ncbi:cytochrome O ubiquinol oxidase [Acidithiobacillus marinus]|uniref:Cytochrome O ubiquinol oxidase n=1 Tax=Acidithiobacillus marinus TaxID=187490 RepID=A0A2I1DP40_9PROT|nr:cytochrome O ubiquinol oxidase [Acidithiobacillus marinus]PKY11641.1 cytochrome O ubiquinol oxidase [Acidithiobacillus marinus]
MSHGATDPTMHPEVQLSTSKGYFLGFAISIALMLLATALVTSHSVPPFGLLMVITVCAGIAVIAQIYFLLHIDISEHNIWNTVALVLFIPLFLITIGLTWWMFSQLYLRTMDMSVMSSVTNPAVHAPATPKLSDMSGMNKNPDSGN